MPEDEFEITEDKPRLEPFNSNDDLEVEKACIICQYVDTCAIIAYVNKLSMKRDDKEVDDEFNCVIFKEATPDTDEPQA